MSWIETWIDTAAAPPLATILTALDESGARGINFYLGGRYSGGVGWTPQLSAELAQQRPDVGQLGTWVSLRPGEGGYDRGHQDGLDAAAAARAYPAIAWLCYDVEPSTWAAWPGGVDDAMRGFADAVHAAGLHVLDYGTPLTVAGASNEDEIWVANPNPGGGDPEVQPLNPAYYAGRRAVQYGSASLGGVTWDLTHSEFSLGGEDMSFTDQDRAFLKDIHDGIGALTSIVPGQPPPLAFQTRDMVGSLQQAVDALKTELDQVVAGGASVPAGVAAAVAQVDQHLGVLGKHLGVDVSTGAGA